MAIKILPLEQTLKQLNPKHKRQNDVLGVAATQQEKGSSNNNPREGIKSPNDISAQKSGIKNNESSLPNDS